MWAQQVTSLASLRTASFPNLCASDCASSETDEKAFLLSRPFLKSDLAPDLGLTYLMLAEREGAPGDGS